MKNQSKEVTDYRKLIQEVKKLVDQGSGRLGGSISNPSMLDRYMLAATYKAFRLCDAILSLCEQGITDEALPTLRSLIEHAINMRWITNKDSNKRLKQYMNDLGKKGFGAPWTDVNLNDRMLEVGFKDRAYFDYCVKVTYSYAHVNASSLKWADVIDDPRLSKNRWSQDALYSVVVQMLGHVLKALDTHFAGKFGGYNDVWKQVNVDKNIGQKIERMRKKSFEEMR